MSSLTSKYELEGMTESQIVDLLGVPSQIANEPWRHYVYYLGRAGLGVDDRLLYLNFDHNGKLENYRVRQD